MNHTVEKIGGTSMSQYAAVRDNIILGHKNKQPVVGRIMVVSAYGGITDLLLEHKKTGRLGVYGLFAANEDGQSWREAMDVVREQMLAINKELFDEPGNRESADEFITARLDTTQRCLDDLQRLCQHGHFSLQNHLLTVREMLASLGEAHSAWNMTRKLNEDGIKARLLDLTGWHLPEHYSLDEQILAGVKDIDLSRELLVATGYAHCKTGLMATFDRGYSEMTFSRMAVLTGAREALIHKEYHLSSADPRLVGEEKVVPIGRTNYDVADQLANLGMEAIHPRAAKGLRQSGIPLRVKNTFEPEHSGTLITGDYVSETPCVEIIAGRKNVFSVEFFDQDMVGDFYRYETALLETCKRFKAGIITKDVNANTITYYLSANIKNIKRVEQELNHQFPDSEIKTRKVAIVSAIGSDMKVPGILAKTVAALAGAGISILAVHQSMRQVDMQFVVDEKDYTLAVQSLHKCLIEVHNHGIAICAA
jgi:aspartate kinase